MVKKMPVLFRTVDGQEFQDEAQAKQHEKLITAKSDYEQSRRRYAALLFYSQRTADGKPFEMSLLHDYWLVRDWCGALPTLDRVSFWGPNVDLDDEDQTVIVYKSPERKDWERYRITDLYYHEAGARRKLLELQKQRIVELENQVKKLEASLEGGIR